MIRAIRLAFSLSAVRDSFSVLLYAYLASFLTGAYAAH
jgi:hypothetical protein